MKNLPVKAGPFELDRYDLKRRNNPVLHEPISGVILSLTMIIGQAAVDIGIVTTAAGAVAFAKGVLLVGAMALSQGLNMLVSGLTSPKVVQTSLSRSPHLINTHDTDEVVMPSYGEFRKGCNWVFADESGGHNKYFNLVLSWAEGLCGDLIYTTDYKPNYTGAGVNDMRIKGIFSGAATREFKIQIDGTGSPNTFKWSINDGSSWVETGVAMTANWYTLQEGVQIKFAAITGHTSGNSWTWMAGLGFWVGESLLGLFEAFGASDKDLADHYWHNGSKTQTVDTFLAAQCPLYADANARTCYSYLRLKYNIQAFPSGVQDFFALAKWRYLFDPREGGHSVNDETTWAYSNNAALVALDWVLRRFGMDRPWARVDETSVEAAANWCETGAKVTHGGLTYLCTYDHTSGASTEPGVGADWRNYWALSAGGVVAWVTATPYIAAMTFNGAILDEQSPEDTLRDIELCYRGFHFERDSKLVFGIFADDTAVMTFTEDDVMIDPEGFTIEIPGIPETPDRVMAWYQEPLENYAAKQVYYPDDAGLANETALNEMELNLIGVTSRQKAKQLAKYHYLRATYNKTYSLVLAPRSYALEPGNPITVTHSFPGWSATKVRVLGWGMQQDNGWFMFNVIEENSAIYNMTVNMANEDIFINPRPYTYPPDIAVGSITAKGDGFSVKITKPTDAVISGYIVYVFTTNTVASSVVIKRISGTPSTATIDLGTVSETGAITLTTAVPYYFWATALDENEHESLNKFYLGTATSGISEIVDTTAPTPPTNVVLAMSVMRGNKKKELCKWTVTFTLGTDANLTGHIVEIHDDLNDALITRVVTKKSDTSANGEGLSMFTDADVPITFYASVFAFDKTPNYSTVAYSNHSTPGTVTIPIVIPQGDIKFLAHFDGPEPMASDFTGSVLDVFGATPTTRSGGVIFRPGKFQKGVQVAQAMTNLVVNPSFEVNITDGWSHVGLDTTEMSTVFSRFGLASLHQYELAAEGTGEYSITALMAASAGIVYTASATIKKVAGIKGALIINWYTSGDVLISSSSLELDTALHDWKRYSVTATAPGTTAKARVLISTDGATATEAWDHYIDGVDFYASSYALPHCDGSMQDGVGHLWSGTAHNSTSSRTAAILRYSSAAVNPEKGCFMCYFTPPHIPGSVAYLMLFDLRDASNTLAARLYWDSSVSKFRIVSGGVTLTCDAVTILPNYTYFFRMNYNYTTDTYGVWVNEVQIGTFSDAITQPVLGAEICVGNNYLGTTFCNGVLDEFCFVNRELLADEGAAIYQSNAPITEITSRLHDGLPPLTANGDPIPIGMTNVTPSMQNDGTGKMQCDIIWDVLTDTGGGKVDYEIEYGYASVHADPASPITDSTPIRKGFVVSGSTAMLTLKDLEPVTVKPVTYWRVRAYDEVPNYTTFCARQHFHMSDDTVAPAPITGTTGHGLIGAIDIEFNLNLTDLDMKAYRVYINTSASLYGADIIREEASASFKTGAKGRITIPVGTVSNTALFTVQLGVAYYMCVCPVDRAGNENTTSPIFTAALKAVHVEVTKYFNNPWNHKGMTNLKKDVLDTNYSPASSKVWALKSHRLETHAAYITYLIFNSITLDFAADPDLVVKRNADYNVGIYLDSSDLLRMTSNDPAGSGWFRVEEYVALAGVDIINFQINSSAVYTVSTGKNLYITFLYGPLGTDVQISLDGGSTWSILFFSSTMADSMTAKDGVYVIPAGAKLRTPTTEIATGCGIEMDAL